MSRNDAREALGRYELLAELGRGRVSQTYKAKSFGVEGFEKTLVVKKLLFELSRQPAFVEAFIDCIRRALKLSHANVVQIIDLGYAEDGGNSVVYWAAEYVAGQSLSTLLERSRQAGEPLPISMCLYTASEVAKGLDHAHRRRDDQLRPAPVIHGSLSARDVLVSWEGDVKISDFGVATALLSAAASAPSDAVEATHAALSPEQARGEPPSVLSDIFALGVLLFESIGGQHPFGGRQPAETLERVREASPPPLSDLRPDVPADLAALVARAMHPDPARRVQSASVLYEELVRSLYELDERFGAYELSRMVERYREPIVSISPAIDEMLDRPLTVPPHDAPGDLQEAYSLPPLTTLSETRHVTALLLSFHQKTPLQKPQRERALTIIRRYGGHVVEESPREIASLFGLFRADGRDTEDAVRAGLVLARNLNVGSLRPLSVVHTGRLRVDAGGHPESPERVARLFQQARSLTGELEVGVAVSPRAAQGLHGRLALEPTAEAYAVTGLRPPRGAGDQFVGRKSELRHLAEVLAAASRGKLQIISILGEQGIGKTRLIDEAERRLRRGSLELATYVTRLQPRGREVPYSAVGAMLRTLCGVREGDPSDRLESVPPRLRALGLNADEVEAVLAHLGTVTAARHLSSAALLNMAVARMLASLSEDRFHVIVWDDAQAMDAQSAELLTALTRRLSSSRLVLAMAGRPETEAPFRSIPCHTELYLGQLSEPEIGQLVALRAGVEEPPPELVDFIAHRAGGHPMFIEELVREARVTGRLVVRDGQVVSLDLETETALPRTLSALLSDRIRRLSPSERALFVAAAVLDAPADTSVLGAMLDRPLGVVDRLAAELEEQDMLRRDDASSLWFPTPLLREVVLAELDASVLAELHRRAAEAYQVVAADRLEEEADRIGYHLASVGERDRAADFYATSGLHHLSRRQLDRAALDMAYALDLADFQVRAGPQLGNWVRALSSAIRYVRSGVSVMPLLEQLVGQLGADARIEGRLRVQIAVDLALMLAALDRYTEADELLARSAGDTERWADVTRMVLIAHGEIAVGRGDLTRALPVLRRAIGLEGGDVLERHRLQVAFASATGGHGNIREARQALVAAEEIAPADDLVLACERRRIDAQILGYEEDHLAAAEAAYEAALEAQELGLLYQVASSLNEQARALLRADQEARAQASLRSSATLADEIGADRPALQARMLLTYIDALDDPHTFVSPIEDWAAQAQQRGWLADALSGLFFAGRALVKHGDARAARASLARTAEEATALGQRALADDCHTELAKLSG